MAKKQPRKPLDQDEFAEDAAAQSGMPKGRKKATKEYDPIYRMHEDSRIPVSKHEGSVWKTRMENGIKVIEKTRSCWQESIKYFNNDQSGHRVSSSGDSSGNIVGTQRLTKIHTETENIVFSNVTTMTDTLYAKNPEVEITTEAETLKEFVKTLEDLLNALAGKQEDCGGFALKGKAKQCVTLAELTNNAWIKVWWVHKEDSSEEAMAQYQELVDRLPKCKSTKELMEVEAHMLSMEEAVAISVPSGLKVTVKSPFHVIIDPTNQHPDPRQDCLWMIEIDHLPTDYLNCTYGEKDDEGRYKSIYKPTHYLSLTSGESDPAAIVNNFSILKEDGEMEWKEMGFTSIEAYKRACYTEVAMVYDKVKKRVLMFATNDWSWPIWVWDDTQHVLGFYPLHKLSFYIPPLGGQTKGEVTYYLDQQDGINEINDEGRRARYWMKRNVLYNENYIKREAVEAYLKGDDNTARGVNLPEGVKFEDVVWSATPPGFKFYDIFTEQKKDKLEAINRISSMNDVLTGAQFRTNTTNKGIENYNKSSSIRTDGRTDSIEDHLGAVFWHVAQLCMMNMTAEDVGRILSRDVSQTWMQITDPQEMMALQLKVVGGSTKKPTSEAKKEEAVQVGQVLGQFADAAPMVVLTMLEVLSNAFDEIVITDEDWQRIEDSIMTQMQTQVGGTPEGAPAPGGAAGAAPQQDTEALISQLPPAVQQAVRTAIDRGVPPETAIAEVQRRAGGRARGKGA